MALNNQADNPAVSQEEFLFAAEHIVDKVTHRWFGGMFDREAERFVVPLLLTAYAHGTLGIVLNKSHAAEAMKCEHKGTAQKYISQAVDVGLLIVEGSEHDGRVDYLVATDFLVEVVERELTDHVEHARHLANLGRVVSNLRRRGKPLEQDGSLKGWLRELLKWMRPRSHVAEALDAIQPMQRFAAPAIRKDVVSAYEEAARLMPTNPLALARRASLRIARREWDKALEDVLEAKKIVQEWKVPTEMRSELQVALEELESTIALLESASEGDQTPERKGTAPTRRARINKRKVPARESRRSSR